MAVTNRHGRLSRSGELRPMTIRVTHIYRRIDGDRRLVHRHADFPPPDQRPGALANPRARRTHAARRERT